MTVDGATPGLNENVCTACESGGTNDGGSETTCYCVGDTFDAVGYDDESGCGALPAFWTSRVLVLAAAALQTHSHLGQRQPHRSACLPCELATSC